MRTWDVSDWCTASSVFRHKRINRTTNLSAAWTQRLQPNSHSASHSVHFFLCLNLTSLCRTGEVRRWWDESFSLAHITHRSVTQGENKPTGNCAWTEQSEDSPLRQHGKWFPRCANLPTNQPVCVHVFSPTQFWNTEGSGFLHWTTTPDIILQTKLAAEIWWEATKSDLQSPLAWGSLLPVESAPEARALCSPALTTCRSVYEGPKLGLLVSSECVVQLLSEGRGHLPRESKEGQVQQGMVSDVAGDKPKASRVNSCTLLVFSACLTLMLLWSYDTSTTVQGKEGEGVSLLTQTGKTNWPRPHQQVTIKTGVITKVSGPSDRKFALQRTCAILGSTCISSSSLKFVLEYSCSTMLR